jgi:hypothetical protein
MKLEIDIPSRIFNAPVGYKRLTINLPIELHTKLKIAAAEEEKTATEIIEMLLTNYLR